MPKKLIARVHTAVFVDGERVVIEPGGEIPDLSEHDAKELLGSGAAKDPAAEAAAQRQDKKDDGAGAEAFATERAAVLAARASTTGDEGSTVEAAAKPTKAAKKG